MELKHYVLALLAIGALNWAACRFGSRQANKIVFLSSAGMPIVLWIGLMAFLLVRDGISTLQDRYFSILLMVVGACTIATSAAALAGQALSRRMAKGER